MKNTGVVLIYGDWGSGSGVFGRFDQEWSEVVVVVGGCNGVREFVMKREE